MFKLLSITKNTFTEVLRQPIYAILIGIAIGLFALSPSLSMYTMEDDNKLLREIGLSTLFIISLLIAIFSASGAVAEELEHKTITTVLSKPVQRPVFILAKYIGICGAVLLAHFIGTAALLMAMRHGVLETASDTHDWTVIVTAGTAIMITLLLSTFFNYTYDWKFTSTAVVLLGLCSLVGLCFLAMFDRHWAFNPHHNGMSTFDIYGSLLLLLAAFMVAALALALSCRFNIVVTLSACIGIFLLGLISDFVFGRAAATGIFWGKIGRYLVPNLQVFWIADAIYEGSHIPIKYIGIAATYAICYTGAILAIAVALFQRRQVG
jgi:ABC-type transport system involved in multi-copper enzyme maturation permease subunit